MIHQILLIAVGAGTKAQATAELVCLGVAHWAIEVGCIRTCGAVGVALQALRANLDVTLGTCAHWSDTDKITLGVTFLAV